MGWWLLNEFWGDGGGPPPTNSGSLKLRLYDPTLLGLKLTLSDAQTQFWAEPLALRLYGTAKIGLRLELLDAVSSNPPTPDTFTPGGPGRVERGTYRHRTAYGIDNGMLSPKDPNTEEHFERDCTRILQTHAGGTIASIVSAVFEEGDDACVVLEGPAISEDGLKWSVKIGDGTSGVHYRYRVRFLTTAGETLDSSIEFYCHDPVH